MGKKRVNPNKQPISKADLKAAKLKYTVDGLNVGIILMLWTLINRHNAPVEDIQTLFKEMEYEADSIARGYQSLTDIQKTLLEEYGVKADLDAISLLRGRL